MSASTPASERFAKKVTPEDIENKVVRFHDKHSPCTVPSLCSAPSHEDSKKPPQSPESLLFLSPTKTDFTTDYADDEAHLPSSNVLAWLQSPTALFSPGSMVSTQQNTPVASTSFFFSDVAALPHSSTTPGICISPLQKKQANTPVDMKEIFASPTERKYERHHVSGMGEHEDEDLSVLLQLAANTTPRNLALPSAMDSKSKPLQQRKKQEFVPPTLGMRQTGSSNGSSQKEMYPKASMRVTVNTKNNYPSAQQPHPQQPYYPMYAHWGYHHAPYPYPPPPARHIPPVFSQAQNPTNNGSHQNSNSIGSNNNETPKDKKKAKKRSSPIKKKNKSPALTDTADRAKAATAIQNLNVAAGGKNDKAAALAAAILRGVTMRPSGKWQAQLYFAGKSRYIGVFDSREKAALAYEIAREKLKAGGSKQDAAGTENLVNLARKAAFDGVNERLK